MVFKTGLSVLLSSLPLSVLAEQSAKVNSTMEPVSGADLLKLGLGLVMILLLIFALAWLMKKMQFIPQSNQGLIRIISAISVGQRERIALIQVGDEQILVGMSPGNMQTLHTLKHKLDVDESGSSPQNFRDRFNQILQKGQSGER